MRESLFFIVAELDNKLLKNEPQTSSSFQDQKGLSVSFVVLIEQIMPC